jgi:hypothetical protein
MRSWGRIEARNKYRPLAEFFGDMDELLGLMHLNLDF